MGLSDKNQFPGLEYYRRQRLAAIERQSNYEIGIGIVLALIVIVGCLTVSVCF